MRTTYRIVMSNGKKSDVQDNSAAAAIMTALKQHPGFRVIKCHSGLTKTEADDLRSAGVKQAMAGYIEHEVPAHDPLTEDEAAQKRARKSDATVSMFDDKAIAVESKMAREKFDHVSVYSKA